jgi:hypothetical protein
MFQKYVDTERYPRLVVSRYLPREFAVSRESDNWRILPGQVVGDASAFYQMPQESNRSIAMAAGGTQMVDSSGAFLRSPNSSASTAHFPLYQPKEIALNMSVVRADFARMIGGADQWPDPKFGPTRAGLAIIKNYVSAYHGAPNIAICLSDNANGRPGSGFVPEGYFVGHMWFTNWFVDPISGDVSYTVNMLLEPYMYSDASVLSFSQTPGQNASVSVQIPSAWCAAPIPLRINAANDSATFQVPGYPPVVAAGYGVHYVPGLWVARVAQSGPAARPGSITLQVSDIVSSSTRMKFDVFDRKWRL